MQSKRIWTIRSLLSCLIMNSILLVLLFIMAKQILTALRQWVGPLLAPDNAGLPPDARSAFAGLSQLLGETEQYLALVVFGSGLIITLALWLILQYQGRRLLIHAEQEKMAASPAVLAGAAKKVAAPSPAQEPRSEMRQPLQASPQTAVQMLAILQREGRLVDFLKEDLHPYTDDQIGAAVRSIHQGCQAALLEHVDLKPIFENAEGAEVTVPRGFDPEAIRLTGNVSGDPPFRGTLRHHGWRVMRLDLPQATAPLQRGWILAPAEVEISE